MAEPVSITAGVLTMLRVSLSAVGTLKSATTTPSEFTRLEKELEHFRDIISDVEALANNEERLSNSLAKNMNNARLKVQEINNFFESRIYRADSESRKVRRTALVKETSRLRAVSNLSNKLRVPFQPGRSGCISSQHLSRSDHRADEGIDAAPSSQSTTFAPVEIAQQICEVPGPHSSPDQMLPSDSTSIQNITIDDIENAQRSTKATVATVAALVRETQRAMILKDTSLSQHIAQIFQELSTNRRQIQHLTETLIANERDWRGRWRRLSKRNRRISDRESSESSSDPSLTQRPESEATIFFDCVSRFSESTSDVSLQQLQTKFSGSPDYFLETSPTFLPERYNLDSIFDGAANLVAMHNVQSTNMQHICKLFFLYSRTPRAWQKVTVTATIISSYEHSAFSRAFLRSSFPSIYFPMQRKLETKLQSVLQTKPLLETVTSLSMTIMEDALGDINVDASSTVVAEDFDESRILDDQRMLQDIDDMGCPQFLESEVIVLKRRHVYEYLVYSESQKCVETKIPFGMAGNPRHNKLYDFIDRLKHRFILRDCENVTRFIGVVLDDSRKQLRSYLIEATPVPAVCWMFIGAEREGNRIPWPIRELWAEQIVSAVSYIHAKGIATGGLTPRRGIGIRSDGSVVVEPTFMFSESFWGDTDYGHTYFSVGYLSPEFRRRSRGTLLPEITTSMRQDLFNLARKVAEVGSSDKVDATLEQLAATKATTLQVKHEGQTVGEMGKIGDVETYFSYPKDKSTSNAILILTDVIGHIFPNAQLIADQFAANGYFVVMPDLFHGDPIPLNRPDDFDIQKWLKGPPGHLPPRVDPVVDAAIVEMRTKYGCKKIGAVGYCFGAKYVVRHLRPDMGKVDVGYCAHPSFVDADELKDIKGPLSISAAETDQIFPPEKRHETEQILPETKQPYQINLFSGVQHGFAVRAEIKEKPAKYAKEMAFLQAVQFFETYLKE
ncbi:MAG: hypothetical protein Q9227_006642 [Pyrenula ochraceoflavens]